MAAPLTAADYGRLLRPLLSSEATHLGLAVSGGADSMALALLTRDWAKTRRIALTAFIVDHGLRPDSATEARQAAAWLKAAGVPAKILRWQGMKPAANRQAAARDARYALLAQACAKAGIRHLLVAQHREDQAETVLLRAARGSGVDGLAAMSPRRALSESLTLLRPLLDIPKARLVATLTKRKQPWIEDPSNANPAYLRVRVRRALDVLSGGDAVARAELVTHLAQTARNFARTRAMLDGQAYDLLHGSVRLDPAGIAWLDRATLGAAPGEIALRALSRLLSAIGGDPLPPRLDRLERLLAALQADGTCAPQSLHRCQIRPIKGEQALLICREARHLPDRLALKAGRDLPGIDFLWDGRFRIRAARSLPAGLVLAPLGAEKPQDVVSALPKLSWPTLPALWKAGKLLAVPGLNWGRVPPGLAVTFRPQLLPSGPEVTENH